MPGSEIAAAARELVDFGRAAVEAGLAQSTAGNVSVRLDDDRMLVSAAGSELGDLHPGSATVVGLADGSPIQGPPPSLESDLHRQVYVARASVGALLHCQSRAATLLACRDDAPSNLDFIPEVPAYVRAHAYVPYAPPGSRRLADSVAEAFGDAEVTVVQLRNHGQVVIGSTWREALRRAVFFELACWLAVQGGPLRLLSAEESAQLRRHARDV